MTAYRSGIRLGPDTELPRMNPSRPLVFSVEIRSNGPIAVTLDSVVVFETFFLVDGIPSLAFMAWGDEHEFECDFKEIELIATRSAVLP